MDEIITCPICGTKYIKGNVEDEKCHRLIEKRIASGIIPYEKRETIKNICDNALIKDNPHLAKKDAKWLLAYMRWLSDLENELVKISQFNEYMLNEIASS